MNFSKKKKKKKPLVFNFLLQLFLNPQISVKKFLRLIFYLISQMELLIIQAQLNEILLHRDDNWLKKTSTVKMTLYLY